MARKRKGTSLLDRVGARELLADARLEAEDVRGGAERLTRFLQRYLPLFYREEQRGHATRMMRGLISGLERKTVEPIARQSGVQRKPMQNFVGQGAWDDEAVMEELRRHVGEELADSGAVLVIDPSTFPKKGTESCGVKRQWCGQLGKIENCQAGVFLAYAAGGGWGPLDRRLFLPEEWARGRKRRVKTKIPREVEHQEKWRIGLEMVEEHGVGLPHAFVAADDELGRVCEFRRHLRERGEGYVLDVPSITLVRDMEERRPPRRPGSKSRRREPPLRRAAEWAARQPASRWRRVRVRDGEKGPLEVDAMRTRVKAKDGKKIGPEEQLLVMRTVERVPRVFYVLCWDAGRAATLEELVRAARQRHRIEELFQIGKGETGLDHYEVRSWVGWHHHMTLSLAAVWFLQLEKRRAGKKMSGVDRAADA